MSGNKNRQYRKDSYQNILIHYLQFLLSKDCLMYLKRPNHLLGYHFQNHPRNLPYCLMDTSTFHLLHLQFPKWNHHKFAGEFQWLCLGIVLDPSYEILPLSQNLPLYLQKAHMQKFPQWQQELYPPQYKHRELRLLIDYHLIPVMDRHQMAPHLILELSILQHQDSIDGHLALQDFLEYYLNYLSKKGKPMLTLAPTFHYYNPNQKEYCNSSHYTLHQIKPLSRLMYQQNFALKINLQGHLHNLLFHKRLRNFSARLQSSFDHLLHKESREL